MSLFDIEKARRDAAHCPETLASINSYADLLSQVETVWDAIVMMSCALGFINACHLTDEFKSFWKEHCSLKQKEC